jgi:glycosyltransferase involved in cell wall biosynthesis
LVVEAIASIQQQTCSLDEIVIVDDGSIDSTPDVVQQLSLQDSRLRSNEDLYFGSLSASAKGCRTQALACAAYRRRDRHRRRGCNPYCLKKKLVGSMGGASNQPDDINTSIEKRSNLSLSVGNGAS